MLVEVASVGVIRGVSGGEGESGPAGARDGGVRRGWERKCKRGSSVRRRLFGISAATIAAVMCLMALKYSSAGGNGCCLRNSGFVST